ncbi:hypothetical protein EYR40_009623 [Pleurotus pulmonarius]|nr:hypothetical protein EYR40_009623 [Pleurotus pulmonarius]
MPQLRESLAHYLHFQHIFSSLKDTSSFQVLSIWADIKQDEEEAYGTTDGNVVRLNDSCDIRRGGTGDKNLIWPPRCKPSAQSPLNLSDLELKGGEATPDSLILDFGPLWLSVAFLSHTSLQFYTKEMWYNSVLAVPQQLRGFSVGLAVEFASHVLAFLTVDLLFQPIWVDEYSKVPRPLADIYTNFDEFLLGVAAFVENVLDSRMPGLAVEEIRSSKTRTFPGVGVYTTCELFFLAGECLPIYITIQELCQSPSRVARLCLALWEFTRKSHADLWNLLSPCFTNNILSPTRQQRMAYSNWLMVYAKSHVIMPSRMASLIDDDAGAEIDIFEPGYLRAALEMHPCLGPLVFGQTKWGGLGGVVTPDDDPLTSVFRRRGLLDAATHIDLRRYTSISPEDFLSKGRSRRPTFLYSDPNNSNGTQSWTIGKVPESRTATFALKLCKGAERESRLFATIVNKTTEMAIGPLEYYGNGHILKIHGGKRVFVVQGDPALSDGELERYLRGIYRIKNMQPGRGKLAKTPEHEAEIEQHVSAFMQVRKRIRSNWDSPEDSEADIDAPSSDGTDITVVAPSDDTVPGDDGPPLKKTRLSVDKRLAITNSNDLDSRRRTRLRTR